MNTLKVTIANLISIEGSGPYAIGVIVVLFCALAGIGWYLGLCSIQAL